ncbi:MAG TPA: glycosyltransferase [Burkholderiaceae bacterium]|nr:glycosyltransferase [Burkholderiaceae bacterium]
MEKPRINLLFIASSLVQGGAEKHVITLLNHLDATRFGLSLAYLKKVETLLPQIERYRLSGDVFCCDVSSKIDWSVTERLAKYIDDNMIDIVVCINTYSLFYGWLAKARSRRRPRLMEIFHTTKIISRRARLQLPFYRPLFLACDMLVYVCKSQRQYWRARALRAKSDTVINNGIDLDRFSARYGAESRAALRESFGVATGDYVVGLCAALRPEKAHEDLLQAVARLKVAKPDIRCIFIGDGPERPRIERMIETLDLAPQVRITGFMEDVRPLVDMCDVMALVSHGVETFSIAALEAMALQKPMVMSRVGGAAEQVIDGVNGYLYRRGDIDALTEALSRLSDVQQRERMGRQARSIVEQQFSLPLMIDAYERLFSGMTQMGSHASAVGGRHAA